MALFHVYVEGPTDPSPEASEQLAGVMAERYGLPIADVRARLAKGRFRVKANVDRETADVYIHDLGAVGARVVVEEAGSKPSNSMPPVNKPARAATPPAGTRTTPPPMMASGLSAAFASNASQDLGALGGDSGSFSLGSVGGVDDHPEPAPAPAPAFSPPQEMELPKPSAASRVSRTAMDAFAPPDAEDDDQRVELAADEIERQQRKRVSTPPASVPVVAPPTPQLQRKVSSTSMPPLNQPVTALPSRGRLGPLSDPNIRFAAGIVVAILLAFIPAHLIASSRERDAFQKIDGKYLTDTANASTPDQWASYDAPAMADKKDAQKSIATTSFAIWMLLAAGLGYVWFKRVPWDKLDAA